MNVTTEALAPMRRRQELLVAEAQAGRDAPDDAPTLSVPVRVLGARVVRDDSFVNLHDPRAVPEGPMARLGLARPRPVRRDSEAVGLLHHLLQWASGGVGDGPARVGARLRRFAELKIAAIGRSGPTSRDHRGGVGR